MILNKNIKCIGCGACEIICSQNTLKVKMSSDGFYKSYQVKDNCTECALCERVCPVYCTDDFAKPISFYSAYSNNPETRLSCSSGGIAHEIGTLLLSKGYKVCGVIYSARKKAAEHTICKDGKALDGIKGSKYIQSYTVDAFKEILNRNEDEKYLIIGTPCQIAGIDKYARLIKKRNNLILVDFFCHGTPSYLVWKEYIRHMEKKRSFESIKNVRFRDKKYGWHDYTIAIETGDGIYYSDRNRDRDLFYEMFLGNYCLNEGCYSCKFRTTHSKADIRIGDLWGSKYADDRKGVSGVITFTDCGEQVMSELGDTSYIKAELEETVTEGQIKGDIDIPKVRREIIADLRNEKALPKICNKQIIPIKIKWKVKRVLRIGGNK